MKKCLEEKNIPFESKHIKLCDQYSEGENIQDKFLKINPLGTVPAIDINGDITCNSEEIIRKLNDITNNNEINLYADDGTQIQHTNLYSNFKSASNIDWSKLDNYPFQYRRMTPKFGYKDE